MKSTRRPETYPGTQAVLRAVALLKAFTSDRPERGLADLSRAVGLNKTTAYRLLAALESERMVERGRDGESYRLGPELVALGGRAQGALDLREASRAVLASLAQETRETATLEVLVGRETLILDEAMGSYVLGSMPSIGTRWPAHATSTGKTILAFLSEDERNLALPRVLTPVTNRTLADRAALERDLARVRERGYATSQEELEPGFIAVGAPVYSADGRVAAAISVGGPKVRLTPEAIASVARRLPKAAARISAKLGFEAAPVAQPLAPSTRKAK
ncbi:MAG TPA: IclR family transcriptional regulator [Vicinamibacteria bacterium]